MSDGDLAVERAEARIGEVLHGKWKLDRLLGVGGMAAVYAATHRNGKRGAVKLLHPELSRRGDAKARFLREGYVANAVGHPGAVSVLDDDTCEDGSVYLVMELLEGSTVDSIAASRPNKQLEILEVVEIAEALLDVVAFAHEKGIVHRDLKPENLFLTNTGQLRVLDFGIARLRQDASSVSTTRTGDSMGTPAFMPPEQALGDWDAVDGRSDLWAVGATMYTLSTGRYVHEADNVQKMMLAAMTRPAPAVRSLRGELPEDVAGVIDTALRFRREERWADASAMLSALRAAKRALGPLAPLDDAQIGQGAQPAVFAAMTVPSASTPSLIDRRSASSPKPHVMTAAPVSSDPTGRPKGSRAAQLLGVAGVIGGIAAVALAARMTWSTDGGKPPSPPSGLSMESTATATAVSTTLVEPVATAGTTMSSTASATATDASSASTVAFPASASASTSPTSFLPRGRAVTSSSAPTSDPRPTATAVKTTFDGRF